MKLAIICDTHFGEKNDSEMFLNYQEEFFSKVFYPTLIERKITHIVHLGDLVHRRKYINFQTSARMRQMFFDPIIKNNLSCDIIVGNHDTTFKNTNDINSLNELVSGRYPNIRIFQGPSIVVLDGTKILYVPWIPTDAKEDSYRSIRDSKASICFGHLEIKGFLNNDKLPIEQGEPPELFDHFDVVYSGHIHHQMFHDNIRYLGSPYEMTWADAGEKKGFHIFDTNTKKLEFIENPFQLHHKVVYNDELYDQDTMVKRLVDCKDKIIKVVVEEKTDPYAFDQFLRLIQEDAPYDMKIVDNSAAVEIASIEVTHSDDTLTYINKHIDNSDVGCDKSRLKYYLAGLYRASNKMDLE